MKKIGKTLIKAAKPEAVKNVIVKPAAKRSRK
jgi:hypothetical protein